MRVVKKLQSAGISLVAVVVKPGKMRMCLDARKDLFWTVMLKEDETERWHRSGRQTAFRDIELVDLGVKPGYRLLRR